MFFARGTVCFLFEARYVSFLKDGYFLFSKRCVSYLGKGVFLIGVTGCFLI